MRTPEEFTAAIDGGVIADILHTLSIRALAAYKDEQAGIESGHAEVAAWNAHLSTRLEQLRDRIHGGLFDRIDAERAAASRPCPCGCSGGPDDCICGMRCVCTDCAHCDAVLRGAAEDNDDAPTMAGAMCAEQARRAEVVKGYLR